MQMPILCWEALGNVILVKRARRSSAGVLADTKGHMRPETGSINGHVIVEYNAYPHRRLTPKQDLPL
jgi:hypothetical protein